MRENQRLRISENTELKRIFGRAEVTVEWRKLHDEKLHNLYFSPSNITVIK
jgi:hypothetical protein